MTVVTVVTLTPSIKIIRRGFRCADVVIVDVVAPGFLAAESGNLFEDRPHGLQTAGGSVLLW